MKNNKVLIGLTLAVIALLFLNKKKKCNCGCKKCNEKSTGGGVSGGSETPEKVSTKEAPIVLSGMVAKDQSNDMINGYAKDDICACKKAVDSVMATMKFASQDEASMFRESEIVKCLNTN